MHVRLNVPRWRAGEIAAGLRVLLSPGRAARAVVDLAAALEGAVDGRVPVLVDSARSAIAAWVTIRRLRGRGVAVPAYVCPAVTSALASAGARPVPLDTGPCSFRFDARAVAVAASEGRIAAVVAAATYGASQDLRAAAVPGVAVLDDAAYLAGRVDPSTGAAAGGGGDAGCWSFSFKALDGVGGGALWVARADAGTAADVAGRSASAPVGRFVDYAVRSRWRHRVPRVLGGAVPPVAGEPTAPRAAHVAGPVRGMAGLQAAVALAQWRVRAELAARADANARVIRVAADAVGGFVTPAPTGAAAPHLLPLLVAGASPGARGRRDAIRAALHARGVQTEDPYPLAGSPDAFPNAADLAARLLLLPCGPGLEPAEAERVAVALRKAANEAAP